MEDILDLYAEPYDERFPVVCFDEMPIRLLENIFPEVPARPDKPHIARKQDYSFEPYGIYNALVFFEPLTGQRKITISKRKTKVVFAEQLELLNKMYPKAERIRLVMDNYSTHQLNACYAPDVFDADKARELVKRIEVHYTPVHASWLNMVEIELSIFARQCLKDARIPTPEVLEDVAEQYESRRNEHAAKIIWTFRIPDARVKLARFYPKTDSIS